MWGEPELVPLLAQPAAKFLLYRRGSSVDEKRAALDQLPACAVPAMARAIRAAELCDRTGCCLPDPLDDRELVERVTGADTAEDEDFQWELRVHAGPTGRFVEFFGWPGDNQHGAGVFAPPGRPFEAVFVNCDQNFSPADSRLARVVELYEAERRGHECAVCEHALRFACGILSCGGCEELVCGHCGVRVCACGSTFCANCDPDECECRAEG